MKTELTKAGTLKLEVVTMSLATFRQLRLWCADLRPVLKDAKPIGWVNYEETWLVFELNGTVGRVRAVDYVTMVVGVPQWRDGTRTQVMDRYPQVFVK